MAIKGGYYIKARCISDSWIAHSAPVVRETWDYLLREANHQERKYNGYTLKRGQLFRTYRQIRDALSWKSGFRTNRYSGDQMKHTMKVLSGNGMITLTGTPRGMIVTVCKYEYYQNPKNYGSTDEYTNGTPTGTPTVHQQSTSSNKNVKNEKKDNKNTTSEKPVIEILLIEKDGTFQIFQNDIDEWKDTFPAVDIVSVLKRIRQWNKDNPGNRKTRGGIRKHISNWLGKEQDKSARLPKKPDPKKETATGRRSENEPEQLYCMVCHNDVPECTCEDIKERVAARNKGGKGDVS